MQLVQLLTRLTDLHPIPLERQDYVHVDRRNNTNLCLLKGGSISKHASKQACKQHVTSRHEEVRDCGIHP